jgi:hypothetical protein
MVSLSAASGEGSEWSEVREGRPQAWTHEIQERGVIPEGLKPFVAASRATTVAVPRETSSASLLLVVH